MSDLRTRIIEILTRTTNLRGYEKEITAGALISELGLTRSDDAPPVVLDNDLDRR